MVQGGCQRRGAQEPYAPLLGALSHHVGQLARAQAQRVLQGCAWLVKLLPELVGGPIEPLPAWSLPPEQERRLMFSAVERYLRQVAGAAGTLLVLDDMQWADPGALDLLRILVQGEHEVPLRFIVAYRDTEVGADHHLAVLLGDLAQAGLAVHRTLAPLSGQETTQLLEHVLNVNDAPTVAASLRDQIVQRTAGVPFFLISYADELREAPTSSSLVRESGARFPWTVAQSVRQRVAALPEAVRTVLDVAAVAGAIVDPTLIAQVLAPIEHDVPAALDIAGDARLLRQDGQAYRFAHDLIHEVIEAQVGVARRLTLHRQLADALEHGPGDPPLELLAHHYVQGNVRDKAALYLESAGDRARAGYANTTAAAYFGEAAETLAQLGRHRDAARVREKWGLVLRAMGHFDAAREVFEQAIATYEAADDLESVARALAETWLLYQESGTADEGLRRYREVAERLAPRGPSPGLSALYAAMGVMFVRDEQYAEFLQMADRAVELARGLEDPEIRAEAEVKRGHAMLFMVGRLEEAMRSIEEAVRLGEGAGAHMPNLGGWYSMLASAHLARGEVALSRRLIARGYEVAERQGNLLRLLTTAEVRADIAFAAGDWARAEGDYAWIRETSRQMELPFRLLDALLGLGRLALARGDREAAAQALDESEALIAGTNHGAYERMVSPVLAERDILAGRPAAASARLVPLLARSDAQGRYLDDLPVWLAWARAEEGKLAEAGTLIERAIASIRIDDRRLVLVDALRVQALVALKQGCWVAAERSLDEGLSVARAIEYPYGEARLLHLAGRLRLQTGSPDEARERFQEALALFRQLGAGGDIDVVKQALA